MTTSERILRHVQRVFRSDGPITSNSRLAADLDAGIVDLKDLCLRIERDLDLKLNAAALLAAIRAGGDSATVHWLAAHIAATRSGEAEQ